MTTRQPKSEETDPPIQLLNTAKCSSISGRSQITYSIGVLDDTEIHVKLVGSSGGGEINNTWTSFADILKLLENHTGGVPFNSRIFDPLFGEISRNQSGFTLALALKELLVVPHEGKRGKYVFNSADVFLAKVEKLIAAKASKPSPRRKVKAST